jgi:hypothetical protein
MERSKTGKIFMSYILLIISTIANLMIWSDSRPGPMWISILAGLESLALLNIWLGTFLNKKLWEITYRLSFWMIISFLLLRLMLFPFSLAV